MKSRRNIPLTITVISAIIGFMLAIQFKTFNAGTGAESKDMSQLRQDLQKVMEQRQRILTDISKYDQLLREYEDPENQAYSHELMKEELERIKAFGGLAPIEGRGLVITINEMEEDVDEDFKSLTTIFDDDLRYVVNELFGSGALAISINEHRLTPQTAIRNVGDDILIDTKLIRMPFVIKVIGNPEVLESAMQLKGFEEYFRVFNKEITFEKLDKMRVPAYDGGSIIRYMTPLKEGV